MARADKLIERMRSNPAGDWQIGDLKRIADRLGIAHRQPSTSHVTFRHSSGRLLTVPARKPIKPVYIREFVALIDMVRSDEKG
jgi:hypothetical protein